MTSLNQFSKINNKDGIMKNKSFQIFSRNQLKTHARDIAVSVRLDGICYITGFEDEIQKCVAEFNRLKLNDEGTVNILSKQNQRIEAPKINSILNSSEFNSVKRKLLGFFCRNAIETFVQSTGKTNKPASGDLHFDKRRTVKVWAYLDDVSVDHGAMRVVPRTEKEVLSSAYVRANLSKAQLRDRKNNSHYPEAAMSKSLETLAQPVTGEMGTLFIHDTDAWHGASPVIGKNIRKIVRAHNRPLKDLFRRG